MQGEQNKNFEEFRLQQQALEFRVNFFIIYYYGYISMKVSVRNESTAGFMNESNWFNAG